MPEPDQFDTAGLRAAVLASWADSPTRFREDANAEEDLLLGGYADRWLVELAQNAADAARRAGRPGRLLVRVVPGTGAPELRVANTGAPLDADGVTALGSLRASSKRDADTVGRFGVGFAAVLGVSSEPVIVSAGASGAGGVRFSAEGTRAEVAALTGAAREELERRAGRVPVLRLPWPVTGEEPPPGYDTEVRLPLAPASNGAPGADLQAPAGAALIAAAEVAAPDLLLALPWLAEIGIVGMDGRRTDHRRIEAPDGTLTLEPGGLRWLLVRRTGQLTSAPAAVEEHADWSVCWALPLDADGRPEPLTEDVLHAPTPSDERLALPARLLATFPMQPSRRRIRPGAATDEVVRAAATAYLDLVMVVAPDHRALLAPTPGFPLGDLDAAVGEAVTEVLEGARWLPSADGETVLAPGRARVLEPAGSPELAGMVADAIPELLADSARSAPRAALTALGVRPIGLAELADRLAALRLPPPRWHALYEALAATVDGVPDARDELAALPVPLVDGRTVTGPRSTLILDADPEWVARVAGTLARLDVAGVRIVHPDAVHPLLTALGAVTAGPEGLLDHPGIVEAVRRSADDGFDEPGGSDEPAGLDEPGRLDEPGGFDDSGGASGTGDGRDLAGLVLSLVAELTSGSDFADSDGRYDRSGFTRPWLAALALPDADGDVRRADELMLPDAAIRPLLAPDCPLGVLDPDLARTYPRGVFTSVGVLDSFAVVIDEEPVGPDHDLDDEERWWDELPDEPSRVVAVRDLDLVDDDAWPATLALLAADPACRRALYSRPADGPSYTSWWLARNALLAGHRPGYWRLVSASTLAGLFDPVPSGPTDRPEQRPTEELLAAVGVRGDPAVHGHADAVELLGRLGDPAREPDAALTRWVHAELADAVIAGRIDPSEFDPPQRLRSMAGTVVDAERAVLLDRPWLAPVLPTGELVSGLLGGTRGSCDRIDALAELLDLPRASEVVSGTVVSDSGRLVRWSGIAEVVTACAALGVAVPEGELWVHDELTVELSRPSRARHSAPTWQDDDGRWHAADPLRALIAVLTIE
jgi:hypothetical protein